MKFYHCLLAAGVCLVAAQSSHAVPQLRIHSPFQVLVVDGVEFGFEADVTVCRNRTNRGFGFVELSSADDAVRLVPVWGGVDWRTGGVVLTFVPVIDRVMSNH